MFFLQFSHSWMVESSDRSCSLDNAAAPVVLGVETGSGGVAGEYGRDGARLWVTGAGMGGTSGSTPSSAASSSRGSSKVV